MSGEPEQELPSLFDAVGLPTPERARRLVFLLGLTQPRPATAPPESREDEQAA